MTITRVMIGFRELGISLLRQACGIGKEKARGDYLTAVLRQRSQAWQAGLDILLQAGLSRQDILSALGQLHGYEPSYPDRAGAIAKRVPSPLDNALADIHCLIAFCDLLLEYNAGHRALTDRLEKETDS